MKWFYLSIGIAFYFFPFVLSEDSTVPTINHKFPFVYFFILFVFAILLLRKKANFYTHKFSKMFLIITFSVYVFLPLATFNVVELDVMSNINTIIFDFIFILVIIIISSQSRTHERLYKIMVAIFVGNGLYIFPQIFMDYSQLLLVENYVWIQEGERVARATYGMRHPNFTGTVILIEIFCTWFLLYELKNKLNKAVLISVQLVLILALITTGNRAAVYGILIAFLFSTYLFILKKINGSMRNLIILYSIGSFSVFIAFFFDWNNFYSSSASLIERYNIMKSVFEEVHRYGDYVFGIAPLDQIGLAEKFIFLRNDNWFIQTIVLYGAVGLVSMIILIIYILLNEVKSYFRSNDRNSLFKLAVFIGVISYSTMEITLFAHGYPLSLFLWIVVLSSAKRDVLSQ